VTAFAADALTAGGRVVADTQAKSPNGALGLLVFLFVAAAVAVLFRSMTKHLRKARSIEYDDVTGPAKKDDPAGRT
jgi:hypothetical protein